MFNPSSNPSTPLPISLILAFSLSPSLFLRSILRVACTKCILANRYGKTRAKCLSLFRELRSRVLDVQLHVIFFVVSFYLCLSIMLPLSCFPPSHPPPPPLTFDNALIVVGPLTFFFFRYIIYIQLMRQVCLKKQLVVSLSFPIFCFQFLVLFVFFKGYN